ncbi:autotransporter-associated beta strand repeat-containing protein, partial [Cedecea sp. VD21]
MKIKKIAMSISMIAYGINFGVSASSDTVYESGSREFASFLTYSEKYNTSSNFVVTGSGTSIAAKYTNTLPLSGTISIGNGAASGDKEAYMQVQNGATVLAEQNIFIGSDNSLSSYIVVSGNGSSLTSPQIRVGNAGGGKNNILNIIDGGKVNSFDVYTGYGAEGTINVQGNGSALTVKPGRDAAGTPFQQLTIGSQGFIGELNVSDGGIVNVSNGALLSMGGTGYGRGGTGYLNISNGGIVNADMLAAGNSNDNSDTAITVMGEGSALNVNTFYLGADEGTAKTTVTDGASITVADKLYLATSSAGTTEMIISNGGKLSIGGQNGIVYGGSSIPPLFTLDGGILQAYKSTLTSSIDINLNGNSISSLDTNSVGMSLSGIIAGTGSLQKLGDGTLILGGNNTYTGDTLIEKGTLKTGVENAIMTSHSLVVNSGASLDLGGYNQQVNALSGKGEILLGDNTLTENNTAGTATTFSGKISGRGGISKNGEGSFILSGTNTYTGTTTVSRGTLKTGVEDTFASTSGVTVAEGATLNLSGN